MIIEDIYESNARSFMAELNAKLSKLRKAHAAAANGGDYRHTIAAHIRIVEAALNAATAAYSTESPRG